MTLKCGSLSFIFTHPPEEKKKKKNLNQRLLKRQEEIHPHEQKPLPDSQNCCNRRKDDTSSRLDSKNTMPGIARSPGQKSQFAPYYHYRCTHHNGKARQHTSFSTKHRIYQTLKMAFNHPSSSKNNTGVITNTFRNHQ